MTGPIPSTDAWPSGSSPFSRRFRDLINSIAEAASWVLENQGDLEDLLIGEETPQAVSSAPLLFAITTGFIPFTAADNRWEYAWRQAELIPAARTWSALSGGLSSTDQGETVALNNAEFKNTADVAAHGVFLRSFEAVGTVEPIPNGTPIILHLALVPEGTPSGTNFRVFHDVNAINFVCTP